jgi:hypothetical protein
MRRALTITLNADLPARARPLDADEMSKVFGGCRVQYQSCSNTNPCCIQLRNDTGSGRYELKCINFTSGTNQMCQFVPR